jgi:hypothetical protein
MNHTYEIEIKSLLGGKEKADDLMDKMKKNDPNLQILGSHTQLNHYFEKGDLQKLKKTLIDKVEPAKKKLFEKICAEAQNYSLRTREVRLGSTRFALAKTRRAAESRRDDGKVLLIIKASIGDDTSANGVARMEFESQIYSPSPLAARLPARQGEGGGEEDSRQMMPLDKLDKLILSCGFEYQAKWSRERSEYFYHYPLSLEGEGARRAGEGEISVAIDKNAGYGYLAEFEKQIEDKSLTDQIREEILNVMKKLEIEELAQDRLERMFAYYNQNWRDYYGTDKMFLIE